jgi:prophage maintenance system killer protein
MPQRLKLPDLLAIAERTFEVRAGRLALVVRIDGAEAALAAPFARFEGIAFYSDPAERAAICCSRIIRNRPFPDGNERIGYECMREMLDRGGIPWPGPSEDAAEIAGMIQALGWREISEREFAAWVKARTEL